MTAFFWQEIVITNIARRNLVLNKQAMCLLVKINIYSNALPFSENFRLAKIFGETLNLKLIYSLSLKTLQEHED